MALVSIACFHGTSKAIAHKILDEQRFLPSESRETLRLGKGAYFFCQMGNSSYAQECALELEKFHYKEGKHPDGYGILSCLVSCDEDAFFDMYQPEVMERFHQMRYCLWKKHKQLDPNFRYPNAAAADTEVINFLRNREEKPIAVVRCPQFFGMFDREKEIQFLGRQYPKTYVPNIVQLCVDTERARISNIKLVKEGSFKDGFGEVVF